jgi:hypothetical protein
MAGKGWHKTTILLKKATTQVPPFCLHYHNRHKDMPKNIIWCPKYAVCKIARKRKCRSAVFVEHGIFIAPKEVA